MQVLYAHIFGITLLNEQETVWGILGSLLIASGVVTVNGAKGQKEEKAQAPFEHLSLLPVFHNKHASMAEGTADGPEQDPETLISAHPSRVGESESTRGNVFQATLSWLWCGGQRARGWCSLRQTPFQNLQLAALASSTDTSAGSASASAADGDAQSSAAGSGCYGQLLRPGIQQEGSEGYGGSPLEAAEGVRALAQEKRRFRGRPGGPTSLRDGENSWVGEWAFRKAADGEALAPAMARYHKLLQQDRE